MINHKNPKCRCDRAWLGRFGDANCVECARPTEPGAPIGYSENVLESDYGPDMPDPTKAVSRETVAGLGTAETSVSVVVLSLPAPPSGADNQVRVNHYLGLAGQCGSLALEAFRRAGLALTDQRDLCQREGSSFKSWLRTNFAFSHTHARRMMKLAAHYDAVTRVVPDAATSLRTALSIIDDEIGRQDDVIETTAVQVSDVVEDEAAEDPDADLIVEPWEPGPRIQLPGEHADETMKRWARQNAHLLPKPGCQVLLVTPDRENGDRRPLARIGRSSQGERFYVGAFSRGDAEGKGEANGNYRAVAACGVHAFLPEELLQPGVLAYHVAAEPWTHNNFLWDTKEIADEYWWREGGAKAEQRAIEAAVARQAKRETAGVA